jgi:hypothetical protein
MEINFKHMKRIKSFIINLDKKKLLTIQSLFLIFMVIVHYNTDQKLKNGYQFLLFFFSILPLDLMLVIIMFKGIYELEGPPRDPFYLMKYPAYFMIMGFGISPFLYLWGMHDVISHLKW